MRDEQIDSEILAYVAKDGKLIPQRCTVKSMEKRSWLKYINTRFSDITSEKDSLREIFYRLLNGIESAPVCKACGTPVKFSNNSFPSFCCAKCRNNDPEVKRKNSEAVSSSLKKAYDDRGDSIKEKREKTLFEKYGSHSSSAFSVDEIREKAVESVRKKYGVGNVMELPEFHTGAKEKTRNASAHLWKSRGYDISYTDHDTVIIRNGCEVHGDIEMDIRTFANRMKPERRYVSPVCVLCHPIGDMSGQEKEMRGFLDSLGVEYVANDRNVIKPLELDFYLPKYRLAIEMNGVYFHSESFGKDRNYHKRKTDMCESSGIRLIHIWETDWLYKNELIRSMLKSRLRKPDFIINARDCSFVKVSSADFRRFLEENHLQGPINAKYKFGLAYSGKLVSVMGFGNMRISVGAKHERNTCELYRFCNMRGYSVRGGASKLFSHAVEALREEGYESIVTYAKRDWSDGTLYSDILGFTLVGHTEPGYFWADSKGNVLHRYSSRKSEIAHTEAEKTMSESEIMILRGFMKCYDSGNLVFRYEIKQKYEKDGGKYKNG